MHVQRFASVARAGRNRRIFRAAVAVVTLTAVTVLLARLTPAAPTVDRATVWTDTVKRGPIVRNVGCLGTLVPEDIRWIPAETAGRVEPKRLEQMTGSVDAQLAVQQAAVERMRTQVVLKQSRVGALKVRAGIDGVLQVVPVEVGQQVAPGTNLARVVEEGAAATA